MEEDFVTFEITKKLKEKGFDYPCINAINSFKCTYRNGWCEYLDNREDEHITQKDLKEGDYLLPTIPQVLKWLREEKQLFIEPSLFKDGYEPYIQSTIFKEDKDYTDTWRVKGFHPTYEAAAIAGIEYVIDNLI